MKRFEIFLFVSLVATSCQKLQSPKDVVARVGNSVLTLDQAKKQLFKNKITNADLESVVIRWVDDELLYRAALQANYQKDVKLKTILINYKRRLIGQAYLNGLIQQRISVAPAEIDSYYQKNLNSFKRVNNEALALHFIVSTKTESQKILSVLKKGETNKAYAMLLDKYQVQPVVVSENHLINELNSALFIKKSKRTLVGPIRTKSGYHILKVVEKYPRGSVKNLADVYDEIQQRLIQTKASLMAGGVLDSLRREFHSEINLEGHRAF